VQAGERRLLSIESELSVARRMQLGSLLVVDVLDG